MALSGAAGSSPIISTTRHYPAAGVYSRATRDLTGLRELAYDYLASL